MENPRDPPAEENFADMFVGLIKNSILPGPQRTQFESELMQLIQTQPQRVIGTCVGIIMTPDVPSELVYHCLVAIRLALTPNSRSPIQAIRTAWGNIPADMRQSVWSTILTALGGTNVNIVNMASLCFGLLASAELSAIPVYFQELFSMVERDGPSQVAKTGAINAIGEVARNRLILASFDVEGVRTSLQEAFNKLFVWIRVLNIPNIDGDLKLRLLFTLKVLIRALPEMAMESRFQEEVIRPLLQLLQQNGLPRAAFVSVLDVICNYVKKCYDSENFVFDDIAESMSQWVLRTQDERTALVLRFWVKIALFEFRRKKKALRFQRLTETCTERKSPVLHRKMEGRNFEKEFEQLAPLKMLHLSGRAGQALTKRVFDILAMIKDSDIEEEEECVPDSQLHMLGTVLLQKWFLLYPMEILNEVRNFWMSAAESGLDSLNWVQQHALLLSVMAIVDRHVVIQEVHDFLTRAEIPGTRNVLFYVATHVDSNIPKVSDTALFVLAHVIEQYSVLTSNVEQITMVVSNISRLMTSNPSRIITLRIFGVLHALINACRPAQISEMFDSFMNFWVCAMRMPGVFDSEVGNAGTMVTCECIRSCTEREEEKVRQLVSTCLTDIDRLRQGALSPQSYANIIALFDIISAGFRRFSIRFADLCGPVASSFFGTLRNTQSILWEDALRSLFTITQSLKGEASRLYNGDVFRNVVSLALQTRNEKIVQMIIISLGQFYESVLGEDKHSPPAMDLLQMLPSTFSLIEEQLMTQNYTKDFVPNILKALVLVIKGAKDHIAPEIGDRLFNMFRRILLETPTHSPLDKGQARYAVDVICAVLWGYSAIFETFSVGNDPRLTDKNLQRLSAREPIDKLLALFSCANRELPTLRLFKPRHIRSICAFFSSFNRCFGRSGNVLLNRVPNFRLLAICAACSDDETNELTIRTALEMSKA